MSDVVANDTVVKIDYVLRLSDGEEIDRSEEGEPLEYLHGHQNIIPGLERELTGLQAGDTKEVVIEAADAYGERADDSVGTYPRHEFPADLDLQVGTVLEIHEPRSDGRAGMAEVVALGDSQVTLDFNHPLAGESLHFSVKVISLRSATQEELAHGHAHGAHGHH